MNFKKTIISGGLLAVLVPFIASAQSFDKLFRDAKGYLDQGVGILMTIATLFFIWTAILLIKEKDATKIKDKKENLKWAVVGLFVIVSVWGIIRLVQNSAGLNTRSDTIGVPCPPGQIYDFSRKSCI